MPVKPKRLAAVHGEKLGLLLESFCLGLIKKHAPCKMTPPPHPPRSEESVSISRIHTDTLQEESWVPGSIRKEIPATNQMQTAQAETDRETEEIQESCR